MTTPIRDVLAHKGHQVETVDPNTPVMMAVRRMNERHIGSLVVMEGDELVGIVTERDVLSRVLGAGRDPERTFVGEVMTRTPVVIDTDATVEDVMVIVSQQRCRHLPVVHDGALCGLVSAGDLTAWLVADQRRTIYDLVDYVTR